MEYMLYSKEDILERVDEYTLYCSYLGFDPLIGAKYRSPLRLAVNSNKDEFASFGIFTRTANKNKGYGEWPNEFMWADKGLGINGDIFELVRRLCRFVTLKQAMLQVMIDAGIAEGEKSIPLIDTREKRFQGYAKIDIASKPFGSKELNWWQKINVGKPILDMYQTKNLRAYWLYEGQTIPKYPPKGMGFSYQIFDKHQLYFPQEDNREYRWRTDWTDYCVPGFAQLQFNSPLLIITKAMKDIQCARSFGYEAIGARSESTMIPPQCISLMKTRYKRILILFDNDMKHNGDKYEFDKIYVPGKDKDLSDFCSSNGPQSTAEMLRQITEI